MKEKKTIRKNREVVEMMLTGAERTSLVTDRMKRLYEDGREGSKEGQSETASPERLAVETVQEEMGRTPQESNCVVKTVRRTSARVQRVKESKKGITKAKEAVIASAKAVYRVIKSSVALIGALGGTVVIVILVVCMEGMIFGSAFGIFFTETGRGELTIRTDRATAEEMAGRYFFDGEQRELLRVLIDRENDLLWGYIFY